MPSIILSINENNLSYEIKNNVIILKSNHAVVYEFLLPKNYYIVKIKDSTKNYGIRNFKLKEFVMINYHLNEPHYIPSGYDKPFIADNGVWCIRNSECNQELNYIDTSILTLDDFDYCFHGDARWEYLVKNGFKIPKSFWYDRFYFSKRRTYIKMAEVSNFIEEYNGYVRLIREDEQMALLAHEFFQKLEEHELSNIFNYIDTSIHKDSKTKLSNLEIKILGNLIDNWPTIVSSIENSKVYRLIQSSDIFRTYHSSFISNSCISASNDQLFPFWINPVIDENKDKKRVLTINNQ